MNRKVTLTYEDTDSLSNEEIVANLQSIYGSNAEVKITPVNNTPSAYMKFAISELITDEQALIYFDQKEQYPEKLSILRKNIIKKFLYLLNDVIMENEDSFS